MFPPSMRPPKMNMDYIPIQKAPVYTLHSIATPAHSIFSFHLHEEENNTYRTSAAVFRSRTDAAFFAKLLENHRMVTGAWPTTDGASPMMDLHGRSPEAGSKENDILSNMYINEWSDEEIQDFCMHHNMNMLIFKIINTNNQTLISINVELNELHVKNEYLIKRFQDMLQLD